MIKLYISQPNYGFSIDVIAQTRSSLIDKLFSSFSPEKMAREGTDLLVNPLITEKELVHPNAPIDIKLKNLYHNIQLMKGVDYIGFVRTWMDCEICDIEKTIAVKFNLPNIFNYVVNDSKTSVTTLPR